jgi:hypothetical protein
MRLHSSNSLLMSGMNAGHLACDWAGVVAGNESDLNLRPADRTSTQRRSIKAVFSLDSREFSTQGSDRDNLFTPPASLMEP